MNSEQPQGTAEHPAAPPGADAATARRLALEHLTRRVGSGDRPPVRVVAGPDAHSVVRRWGAFVRAPGWHRLVAVVLAAALVVAAPWWWQLRRPRPAEETLPRADRTSTTADSAPTGAPPSGAAPPAGAVPSGGPGPPDGPAAVSDQVVVHVVGAVVRPGVLRLPSGSRAVDAVDAAGGLAPGADVARVNLAALLGDGQRIVVPVVGEDPPVEILPSGALRRAAPDPGSSSGTSSSGAAAGQVVDLNAASEAELEELPGVGPATAAAIVAHREAVGPFTSVEGLLDVRGIGPAKLEGLRDSVRVG